MRKFAIPILAIYLIVTGLLPLVNIKLPSADLITSGLAIVAGVLLLLGGSQLRPPRGLGLILLAAWLILAGALPLLGISFPAQEIVLGLLAAAACCHSGCGIS